MFISFIRLFTVVSYFYLNALEKKRKEEDIFTSNEFPVNCGIVPILSKGQKNAHYIPRVNTICAKSCRFSWNAAILNILNILNIFINANCPNISIIKLAYPQWICILIWNTLSTVQRPDLVGMNLGSALQLLIHGRTKAGSPSEGSLRPRVSRSRCSSQSKAFLKHGVISEDAAWCCNTAARSPIPKCIQWHRSQSLACFCKMVTAVLAISSTCALHLTSAAAFLKT